MEWSGLGARLCRHAHHRHRYQCRRSKNPAFMNSFWNCRAEDADVMVGTRAPIPAAGDRLAWRSNTPRVYQEGLMHLRIVACCAYR
jgi:hypothetical protein